MRKFFNILLDIPAFKMSEDTKAVFSHEIFKLVTGNEFLGMLPKVTEKMLSATEIGEMFGVSSKKIDKIAIDHGLKPLHF